MLTAALQRRASMVMVETPSNPLMRIVDINAIAQHAKSANARLVVDNTFLSPALQQPIALGADFVVHSTTKYLNGHSDVVGGAIIAANSRDIEELKAWANLVGVTGSSFDSYLTLRGIRTLFPRIEQQHFDLCDELHGCWTAGRGVSDRPTMVKGLSNMANSFCHSLTRPATNWMPCGVPVEAL